MTTPEDNRPGLLALLVHRPPVGPFVILALALAVSFLPEPTNPDAGLAPSALLLPLVAVAAGMAVPHLLRVASMWRSLRTGHRLNAKVSSVEDLTATEGLRRSRFSWTDPKGRIGRSRVLKGGWCPAMGSAIRVVEDPGNGRQWWEGDLPGYAPEAPPKVPPSPPLTAARADLYWAPLFVLSVFLAVIALLLLVTDAPRWLAALPGLAALPAFLQARKDFDARSRALRFGRQLSAKIVAHRRQSFSAANFSGRSICLEWMTREGHHGVTSVVPSDKAPAVGARIAVRIDPVTRSGVWIGEAETPRE